MTKFAEPADLHACYRQAVASGDLQEDPWQLAAIKELQRVCNEVAAAENQSGRSWCGKLFPGLFREKPVQIQGLYLWGGVGRGKTLLMDLFYSALPVSKKLRLHFHRFMQTVHERLRLATGQANPLVAVADSIAKEARVLCFDEFYVSDIGDAMILANLLEALFAKGVVLVSTSNLPPERLYENGLQRKKFLPAIDFINRHMLVLNVQGDTDYRLLSLAEGAMYYTPPGKPVRARMEALFASLARGQPVIEGRELEIQGRMVGTIKIASDVAWFDFSHICQGPRGTADYVELADRYHTVLISGLPSFRAKADDDARRFIALVDEFYDHGVKLVLEAAVPVADLYQGEMLAFAFERTKSRLIEMQSPEYLAAPHRPG